MITEYHRPKTIPEALELLSRAQPMTYALGGGTFLNRTVDGRYAVVDLQDLGLGSLKITGNQAQVGATIKLQELLDFAGLPDDLYTSIRQQSTYNLRQMATIAGTLVTADGRSPFATVMLALDASLEMQQQEASQKLVKLGDWLPFRDPEKPEGLITSVNFPINLKIAFEYIARTPADQAIVCACIAQWNSGRTRLALGGWGHAPVLAMDGPEPAGVDIAARNAYSHAADQWASAEYRQEMAGVLSLRCVQRLSVK